MASTLDEILKRRQKASEPKKKGGFFGIDLPDLGVGNLISDIGAIPGGLVRLGASLAPGGLPAGQAFGEFGRGVVSSFIATGLRGVDAATLGQAHGFTDPLRDTWADMLGGEQYRPRTIDEAYGRGILPGLFEDVGNLALGAAGAAKLAKLGTAGRVAAAETSALRAARLGATAEDLARAAEVAKRPGFLRGGEAFRFQKAGITPEVKEAGRAIARAEGITAPAEAVARRAVTLNRLYATSHPYLSLYRGAVRPLTRAATASRLAGVAEPVVPETPVPEAALAPADAMSELAAVAAPATQQAAEATPPSPLAAALDDAIRWAESDEGRAAQAAEVEQLRARALEGVNEEVVPVYRGQRVDGTPGEFWTTDINEARAHAGDDGVVLESVAPRSAVERGRAAAAAEGHHGMNDSALILEGPWPDLARPLEQPAARVADAADEVADAARFIDQQAADYARSRGLPEPKPVDTTARVDPVRGRIVANLYRAAVSNPDDPAVQRAYAAFAADVTDQWQYLKDQGIRIEFVDRPASGGVYANEAELFADIERGVLKVDRTGPAEQHTVPVMNEVIDTDINGNPVTVNDAFRAVHDYFGHSRARNLFDRHGEDVAWRLHEQMFSDEAKPALFSETVGQNSYLNFAPENVAAKALGRQAQFPEQKAALLPDEVRDPDFAPGRNAGPVEQQARINASDPIPVWASAIVSRLPEPAVKALARADRFITARQAARVVQERVRAQDIARRETLRSPAVQDAINVAVGLMYDKERLPDGTRITPALADELIGDEVIARLDGTEALEWVASQGASDEVVALLREVLERTGARSEQRIPTDWLRNADGSPTELGEALDAVTERFREQAAQRLEVLRSSRMGERGLEQVDADMPSLSPGAQRALVRALKDLERADALERTKVPVERARLERRIQEVGDELTALGERIRAAQEQGLQAVRRFDRSRSYVPRAFRDDESWGAAVDEIVVATLENGGATYDPHQGRLLRPVGQGGTDTGFAVGALRDTARRVQLTGSRVHNAVLLAEAIDEVVRAYQDLYQNPQVLIGTWLDDSGVVHVDVSEVVATRDEALLKAAAREQDSVYDMTKSPDDYAAAYPEPVGRPDVAVEFLRRNQHRTRYARQLRKSFELINERRKKNGLPVLVDDTDIDAIMAMNDLIAVSQAQRQPGRFKHPDMVYATMAVQQRQRLGKLADNPNALFELALGRELTPELLEHAAQVVPNLEKVAAWYSRTHDAITRRYTKPDGTPWRITLGNGKVVDVPDLLFQLIAVTSIQQTPGANLGDALHAIANYQRIVTELDDGAKFWTKLMDDFLRTPARGRSGQHNAKSPRTLTELFERAVKPKEGTTVHRYWIEILNGNTLDTWGDPVPAPPDFEAHFNSVFDRAKMELPIDRTAALKRIDPDVIARLGEDRAVMEYYGQLAFAKMRSFYDNLRNPMGSDAVAMDVWMARLLGADRKLDLMKQGTYLEYANQIRDLTDTLSGILGRKTRPLEVQAVLWAYAMIETEKAAWADFEAGVRSKKPRKTNWSDFADHLANPNKRLASALETVDSMADDTFFQRMQGRILGALVAGENRNVLHFFDDADPVTLAHEHAHALRQILGAEDLAILERAYGITDGRWLRRHEERFAKDFETYLATNQAPTPGLAGYFARIRTLLSEVWRVLRRRRLHSDVRELFDTWFNPARREIAEVDILPDTPPSDIFTEAPIVPERTARTPRARARGLPLLPEVTPSEAYRRGITGGEAIAALDASRRKVAELEARRRRLEKNLAELKRTLLEERLPSQIAAQRLRSRADRRIARIAQQLEDPSIARTPPAWQPLWGALRALHQEAENNPQLAAALEELPQTWSTVLRIAAQRGFDPTHVRSFQPSEVRQLIYEQVRLGKRGRDLGQTIEAGTRKQRRQANARTRSLSALAAAMVEATHELHTNALADFIEQTYARPIEGGVIPAGWVGWDAERSFLLTGERVEGGNVQVRGMGAPTKMIPKEVKAVLDNYQRDFSHPFFRTLRRVTDPWRLFMLTLSPRWYVNNFAGNVILASKEGVQLRDWVKAWQDFRKGGGDPRANRFLRRFGRGREGFNDVAGAVEGALFSEVGEGTLVPPRRGVRGTLSAAREAEGLNAKLATITRPIRRANEVVDELARVAVYHANIRKGLSVEKALQRTYEAMVDYSDLTPFERQVVRAVVPFYAWQKGILKLVAKFPIDHPIAAGIGLQLAELNRELAADELGGEVPRYYEGVIDLPLLGHTNVRPLIPFFDAAQLVTPQGIAQSLNPFFEIAARNVFGAPESGFPEYQRINEFGSAVPDTSPAQDLTSLIAGLPPVRLGQSLTGTSITGAPVRPPVQAAGQFAGVPTYTDEEVRKIIQRLLKAQERVA